MVLNQVKKKEQIKNTHLTRKTGHGFLQRIHQNSTCFVIFNQLKSVSSFWRKQFLTRLVGDNGALIYQKELFRVLASVTEWINLVMVNTLKNSSRAVSFGHLVLVLGKRMVIERIGCLKKAIELLNYSYSREEAGNKECARNSQERFSLNCNACATLSSMELKT